MYLSILITNYGSDVTALCNELFRQAKEAQIEFEILISDDHPSPSQNLYTPFEGQDEIKIFTRSSPLGRSANRNFLIENARFQKLILLDGDALIIKNDFIKEYLKYASNHVLICGGTAYQSEKPSKEKMLRWMYGKKREAIDAALRNEYPWRSFSSFNLFADKSIFEKLKFDETLTQYGHEDTLLGRMLKFACIPVLHINNPALHNGLDTNRAFLEKSKKAIENLAYLIKKGWIDEDVKIYGALARVSKFGLRNILGLWYNKNKISLEERLEKSPNLRLLDIYKLAYLCSLARAEKIRGI